VIGSLDGICFRWDALGIEDVKCGGEFQNFCNEWNRKEMSATLWGAFVVICGHFYLIAAGGMVALSNRSVNRALLLYPTNEEYVKLLEKLDAAGGAASFKPSVTAQPEEAAQEIDNSAIGEESEQQSKKKSSFFSGLFGGNSTSADASKFNDEGTPGQPEAEAPEVS